MRIWYFNEKFPYPDPAERHRQYACGGSEVVAERLAVHMARKGNTVDVFTTGVNPRPLTLPHHGVTLHRYPRRPEILGRSFNPQVLIETAGGRPDVVHAHVCTEVMFAFAAWWWARRMSCPLVLTCHVNSGSYPAHFPMLYKAALKIHKLCIDALFSSADVIISPSEGFALENETLRRHTGKLVTVPNGIDLEEFDVPLSKETCRRELGLPSEAKIVLFLGNPHPNKGLAVLLKSMRTVAREVPGGKLLVVGRGTECERMRTLAAELGLGDTVVFADFAAGARKNMYYKSADIFVLPSFYDIFPLTLLEASSFGLPLVVSDIAAFRGFVRDGHNGLVTRAGDEEDLADKLIRLLRDPDERNKVGRSARLTVEDYSWDNVAGRTMQLYEKVARRR